MRILFLTDIHGHYPHWHWLLDRTREVKPDVVAIGGDYVNLRGDVYFVDQINTWIELFAGWPRENPPLILATGNHDMGEMRGQEVDIFTYLQKELREELSELLDGGWINKVKGANVFVPGDLVEVAGHVLAAVSFPKGSLSNQHASERQWRELRNLNKKKGQRTVVVSHAPAACILNNYPDDIDYTARMLQNTPVDIMLSGHIHCDPYKNSMGPLRRVGNTHCLNPGRAETEDFSPSQYPNHIVLDIVDDSATYKWSYFDRKQNLYQDKEGFFKIS